MIYDDHFKEIGVRNKARDTEPDSQSIGTHMLFPSTLAGVVQTLERVPELFWWCRVLGLLYCTPCSLVIRSRRHLLSEWAALPKHGNCFLLKASSQTLMSVEALRLEEETSY